MSMTRSIPALCRIERWIAWGSSEGRPGVCHWVACLPDGHLHVFAEWVFHDITAGEAAIQIRHVTEEEILPVTTGRLGKSVGDPVMFSENASVGETHATTFRRMGVYMIAGIADRVFGFERLRHWHGPHPDGTPWMTYDSDCAYAIRTLPLLVRDDTNLEDIDALGEEQAANADRFGVMARPSPTVARRTAAPVIPGTFSEVMADVRRAGRRPGQIR